MMSSATKNHAGSARPSYAKFTLLASRLLADGLLNPADSGAIIEHLVERYGVMADGVLTANQRPAQLPACH